MEEKIDVEVIRYFILIAFIGLWSVFFAIWGLRIEHYFSVFLLIILSIGILILKRSSLYKLFNFLNFLFLVFLVFIDEGIVWDISIIFVTILFLYHPCTKDNFRVAKLYSKNLFSFFYKYSLLLHNIKNILPNNYNRKLEDTLPVFDVGLEILSMKQHLNVKNDIHKYSPLYLSCEKELIIGLCCFIFFILAREGQTIHIEDDCISIINPSSTDLGEEFQRFIRYSLNGNVENNGSRINIKFF